MVKAILKPLDEGADAAEIELPPGKTILGRGTFLNCSDKKVSRNHATIELTDSGEVFLTSTHVNPSYYYLESDTNGQKVLKKDKSTQLNSGDAFSLLQSTYKFKVVIAEGEAAPMPAKTENGASENKSNAVAAKNGDSGVNGKGSDGPKEEAASTSEKAKPKKPAAKVAKEEDEEFEEEEEEDDDDEEEDAPPKGRGKYTKGRPPRMATTAPGKLTKVDDDDYEDDWQEDEDDDDDDYNHQSASDSDWEMDTKGRSSTRGRGRRRDDSDDDSDEDWGSSKKKKKTPKKPARKPTRRAPARGARKGRKQKYESDEEEEEEEELDEDEEEETPKKSKKLKPCPEGKRCKKKNPAHLRDYSHDAASDDEDDDDIDEDEEEDVKKKPSKATARGGSGGGRPKREAATKGIKKRQRDDEDLDEDEEVDDEDPPSKKKAKVRVSDSEEEDLEALNEEASDFIKSKA